MDADKYKKQFEYGNRLGRITGEGRFNNVNSIIVNSHRYFMKDKEENNQTRIMKEEKNKYNTNFRGSSAFDKYRYYPNKEDDGIKRITNDYYDNNKLKEIGKTSFNYSANNLIKNNKDSYFKGTTYALPQSFDSLHNNSSSFLNNISVIRNNYNDLYNKKNDAIEKIFYNYGNNNFNGLKTNSNLMNSSTTMPKFYTLDNGFTSGYNSGSPMARSYSVKNERNTYKSVSTKPELYESGNIKPDNTFLNTSKYFQPNTQRDFHGVYDSTLRTSFLNTTNNNIENNSLYNTNKKLMLTLSPNIILNTIQEEQFKKEMETFHQTNGTFFRDENEYTIKQCSCVKEYSVKKHHNKPYHKSLNCQIFAIDRFNTKLTDGLFGIFDGTNGDEISIYLRQI